MPNLVTVYLSVAPLTPSVFIFYTYLKGGIEQQTFVLVSWISCFFSVNFPSLSIHSSEFVCVWGGGDISLRLTEEVLVVQPSLFAVRTGVALNPLEFSGPRWMCADLHGSIAYFLGAPTSFLVRL
jgi:hypothetical protein